MLKICTFAFLKYFVYSEISKKDFIMNILFEGYGQKYEMQNDYRLPCLTLPQNILEYGEGGIKDFSKHWMGHYNLPMA